MAQKITVTYLLEGEVFRPKIPIWISHNGKSTYFFHALVDSGSDRNLFPAEIGELVGLEINKGKKSFVYGIGNIKIIVYEHVIDLHLGKDAFKTVVDFSYEQQVPLLGRNGFFNLFKRVEFRERKKEVEFKI